MALSRVPTACQPDRHRPPW